MHCYVKVLLILQREQTTKQKVVKGRKKFEIFFNAKLLKCFFQSQHDDT